MSAAKRKKQELQTRDGWTAETRERAYVAFDAFARSYEAEPQVGAAPGEIKSGLQRTLRLSADTDAS